MPLFYLFPCLARLDWKAELKPNPTWEQCRTQLYHNEMFSTHNLSYFMLTKGNDLPILWLKDVNLMFYSFFLIRKRFASKTLLEKCFFDQSSERVKCYLNAYYVKILINHSLKFMHMLIKLFSPASPNILVPFAPSKSCIFSFCCIRNNRKLKSRSGSSRML